MLLSYLEKPRPFIEWSALMFAVVPNSVERHCADPAHTPLKTAPFPSKEPT